MKFFNLITIKTIISFFLFIVVANSQIVKEIKVNGNERVAKETIILFSTVKIDEEINEDKFNLILKELYNTNYFKNISLKIENNILFIDVVERPLIQNVYFKNIKSKTIIEALKDNIVLKDRSPFNEIDFKKDIEKIKSYLKTRGYYFSKITASIDNTPNNLIDINYKIDLGDRAKISKIIFTGDKIFKDSKLRGIITSEEYKFWKFISGKKFLNEDLIKFDEQLIRNFYLNKGYYNVKINSSFAKLVNDESFELIFNINANDKIYFDKIELILPEDYNKNNFGKIFKTFESIQGEPYSLYLINKILGEIDEIITQEQFESIKASVNEEIVENKINLLFEINDSKKLFVERINILGNNITDEKVIRNQLEIDEGDPYNEILSKKSLNNIKNLNFFKTVKSEIVESDKENNKIINIIVEEKPTGEILAGAGLGTNGGTISFAVKENNFQGLGIGLNTSLTISEEDLKGSFSVVNPNFKNTDRSVYTRLESIETDRLETSGYKTNRTGFSLGSNFEYLDDLELGLGFSSYYENITTDSTASSRQQRQKGHYWDNFINLDFIYDKRNQKFQTSKGYISRYLIDLPTISDTNSISNQFNYKVYSELYEDNVSSFNVFLKSVVTLDGDDIKLSERIFVPSKLLRGFEMNKVGPKDGNDFIGGNYLVTANFTSTLPKILPNAQNTDVVFFVDFANLWGVDYDSSLSNQYGSSFRSSIGLGLDWFSPIGPMNFSLAQPIMKDTSDITETFRFNIGTTF